MSGGVVTASLLPEPAPRRHDEEDLQRAVVQFLRWNLPPTAFYFHIPNGGQRHKKVAQRLVGLGLRAGVPDLCVIYKGLAYFIELKAPGGSLSAAQKQTIDRLICAGADVSGCRSVPEVEAILREIGVPLRGRVSA